ncbi:helix-turn-helix domain-containing protein [Buttiauxella sp. B2]|uniref:helix-turn-helix domain-containing protein n=1 Tax=Buttiauxella sp. B2 TaxID=2587812 RepID=UPI001677C05E|nr:helix-turn-helix domain-containing protein [Buttiauxella sp. B2]
MEKISYVKDLISWIDENLDERLTLDTITIKSGYSKWYLQLVFKQVQGVSLGSYVRTRRLTEAARELQSGDHSILDIALKYHFDCQQSFTRAFKREFAMTPGTFRKTAKVWSRASAQFPIVHSALSCHPAATQ